MDQTTISRTAWAPQAGPQTALVDCPFREVFFGGARGGGKTDGVLGKYAIKAAKAALPAVEGAANQMLATIDSLSSDLYLPSMLGKKSYLPNMTTASQRVQSKMDQIGGQSFLQAYNIRRGEQLGEVVMQFPERSKKLEWNFNTAAAFTAITGRSLHCRWQRRLLFKPNDQEPFASAVFDSRSAQEIAVSGGSSGCHVPLRGTCPWAPKLVGL